MDSIKYVFRNCKVTKMIENQKSLQKYTNTRFMEFETLLENYNTAIFVECAEAIQETNFKWWKTPNVNIVALKEELSDIYIFALDLTLLMDKEQEIWTLMESKFVRPHMDYYEKDFSTMISRLKLISSQKFMNLFDGTYGIQVMRAIIDISVMYGYTDIDEIIIKKQAINIRRQENGYNANVECATE